MAAINRAIAVAQTRGAAAGLAALPTLDVAVLDLPRAIAPWIRSPAADRVARLFYLPILGNESEDATKGILAGQIAASFEKGELGRRFTLQLKPGITWSDGTRPVSSIDVVRALSDRTDPRSPAYNARWAHLLLKIQPTDEQLVRRPALLSNVIDDPSKGGDAVQGR